MVLNHLLGRIGGRERQQRLIIFFRAATFAIGKKGDTGPK